jgi:serine/threonine-protein kinase
MPSRQLGNQHPALVLGAVLEDRYRVISYLGAGTSGQVYLCRDRKRADSRIAVKVLPASLANKPFARAEFLREFLIGSRLDHPNLLHYYDTVRESDLTAFSMEYVGGGNLAGLIKRKLPLKITEKIRILIEIARGLGALHRLHVIHHDLKPANILLTNRREVKVSDFGVSRFKGQPPDEACDARIGTPQYISPEYLTDGVVTPLSDIYALGLLAYELVTGVPAFVGRTTVETIQMRFRVKPPAPHQRCEDCPRMLSKVILRAMSLDPLERPQSPAELEDMLHDCTRPFWLPLSGGSPRVTVDKGDSGLSGG